MGHFLVGPDRDPDTHDPICMGVWYGTVWSSRFVKYIANFQCVSDVVTPLYAIGRSSEADYLAL